jgi:hypothetical protein
MRMALSFLGVEEVAGTSGPRPADASLTPGFPLALMPTLPAGSQRYGRHVAADVGITTTSALIARKQLNAYEEAKAVRAMLAHSLTEDGAAQALGWPKRRVAARRQRVGRRARHPRAGLGPRRRPYPRWQRQGIRRLPAHGKLARDRRATAGQEDRAALRRRRAPAPPA